MILHILVLLLLHCQSYCWQVNHRILLLPNGTYLLVEADRTVITIPDNTTANYIAKVLKYDLSRLPVVSSREELEVNSLYTASSKVIPSLIKNGDSGDEALRVVSQLAEAVDYRDRYLLKSINIGEYLNPSIVQWHGKTLMLYRQQLDNAQRQVISMIWLNDDYKGVNLSSSYLGIHAGFTLEDAYIEDKHEDPRGLVLSNGSLLITYTKTDFWRAVMGYTIATVRDDGIAHFGDFTPLRYRNEDHQTLHEKNWVPFEYNNRIYFFTHVNPFIVVTQTNYINELMGKSRNESVVSASSATVAGLNGSLVDIVHGISSKWEPSVIVIRCKIPWIGQYGDRIHGGTPAIRVPILPSVRSMGEMAALGAESEVMLSLFHTKVKGLWDGEMRRYTYFMGAVAFCARPPFNVVMTSRVPIMDYRRFYTGPWVTYYFDYVMFPAGIVLHKVSNSSSEEAEPRYVVWVSMGHQDRYAYLLKFNLNELLASLHFHRTCDPDAAVRRKVVHVQG